VSGSVRRAIRQRACVAQLEPPTTSTGLAGYHVYVRTASGVYGPPINLGNVTSYVVNNLVIGNTYDLVVTGSHTSGGESVPSNQVSKSMYRQQSLCLIVGLAVGTPGFR